VLERLREGRVEVRAVDLPSHHSSSGTRVDDVAVVEKTMAEMSPPVVVVGWSYAGAVITDLDRDSSTARLVYVAAIPPAAEPESGGGGAGFDISWLLFPDEGSCVLNEERWLTETAATFPEEVVEHLRQYPRRPIALQALPLFTPQVRFAWKTVPTTVVLGRTDELIPASRQESARESFEDVRIIESDHFIPFRQPELIADIVVEALNAS
jgi:pimeloyl-ACP methyl ester carboxylesterase